MRRVAKTVLILFASIGLTTVTIEATTNFGVSQSLFSGWSAPVDQCPLGMTMVNGLRLCIDLYEVSAGTKCPNASPRSAVESAENVDTQDCLPQSAVHQPPWRFVTWHQAAELCAKRGTRLPTSYEWYMAALGTRDGDSCVVAGTQSAALAGSAPLCVSGSGVFDMIGNVWEYTAGAVVEGVFDGVLLPTEGYISAISPQGIPTETSPVPNVLFHNDYLWRGTQDPAVVLRGGFYGSGEDSGLYSMQTAHASNFATAGVGFRCVHDLSP